MIEVKETITILCKHLQETVDSTLTPEHFRLAKFDKNNSDAVNAFWTTLDKLSYFTLKESKKFVIDAEISHFDKCVRTKLRLAYLQYPHLEFYSLSEAPSDYGSRILLIALIWMVTKYDVLKNIVKVKLLHSSLGREFSEVNINNNKKSDNASFSSLQNQINNLLYKSNKLSSNLKAISELCEEKVKLTTKVHAASLTTSGLPHLTVSEMSLVKKLVTNKLKDDIVCHLLEEKEKTASMLDTHMKWSKKSHIFYTWMNSVIDECEKSEHVYTNETLAELSKFMYLLRHIVKKNLKCLLNNDDFSSTKCLPDCPSRFLRVQKCSTEVSTCLNDPKNNFNVIDCNLEKKKKDLETELQAIFKNLPNCFQI